jgi:hypothetical protein
LSFNKLRGLVDKTLGQQTKVQQFESTGFQDCQTAQRTSGSHSENFGRKVNKGEKWSDKNTKTQT